MAEAAQLLGGLDLELVSKGRPLEVDFDVLVYGAPEWPKAQLLPSDLQSPRPHPMSRIEKRRGGAGRAHLPWNGEPRIALCVYGAQIGIEWLAQVEVAAPGRPAARRIVDVVGSAGTTLSGRVLLQDRAPVVDATVVFTPERNVDRWRTAPKVGPAAMPLTREALEGMLHLDASTGVDGAYAFAPIAPTSKGMLAVYLGDTLVAEVHPVEVRAGQANTAPDIIVPAYVVAVAEMTAGGWHVRRAMSSPSCKVPPCAIPTTRS